MTSWMQRLPRPQLHDNQPPCFELAAAAAVWALALQQDVCSWSLSQTNGVMDA